MAMGTLLNGHKRPIDYELCPCPALTTNLSCLSGDSQTASSRPRRVSDGGRPLDTGEDVLPPGQLHEVPGRGRQRLAVRHHQPDGVGDVRLHHGDGPEAGWVAEQRKEG